MMSDTNNNKASRSGSSKFYIKLPSPESCPIRNDVFNPNSDSEDEQQLPAEQGRKQDPKRKQTAIKFLEKSWRRNPMDLRSKDRKKCLDQLMTPPMGASAAASPKKDFTTGTMRERLSGMDSAIRHTDAAQLEKYSMKGEIMDQVTDSTRDMRIEKISKKLSSRSNHENSSGSESEDEQQLPAEEQRKRDLKRQQTAKKFIEIWRKNPMDLRARDRNKCLGQLNNPPMGVSASVSPQEDFTIGPMRARLSAMDNPILYINTAQIKKYRQSRYKKKQSTFLDEAGEKRPVIKPLDSVEEEDKRTSGKSSSSLSDHDSGVGSRTNTGPSTQYNSTENLTESKTAVLEESSRPISDYADDEEAIYEDAAPIQPTPEKDFRNVKLRNIQRSRAMKKSMESKSSDLNRGERFKRSARRFNEGELDPTRLMSINSSTESENNFQPELSRAGSGPYDNRLEKQQSFENYYDEVETLDLTQNMPLPPRPDLSSLPVGVEYVNVAQQIMQSKTLPSNSNSYYNVQGDIPTEHKASTLGAPKKLRPIPAPRTGLKSSRDSGSDSDRSASSSRNASPVRYKPAIDQSLETIQSLGPAEQISSLYENSDFIRKILDATKETAHCAIEDQTCPVSTRQELSKQDSIEVDIRVRQKPAKGLQLGVEEIVSLAEIAKFCSKGDPKSKYKFKDMLGEGGFGKVYIATGREDDKKYAAKHLDILGQLANGGGLKYVAHEIETMTLLNHKHIVQFEEGFLDEDCMEAVFIMEYIDGLALNDVVEPRRGIRDTSIICTIMHAVTKALVFMHKQGFVHRDIKSDNVMVSRTGEVKVIDFGTCVNLWRTGGAARRSKIGTPYWMAPEVYKGQKYDEKVDVWSAGILCYECVVGTPPYYNLQSDDCLNKIIKDGVKPLLKNLTISDRLRDFLTKSLRRRPIFRPKSSDMLKHDFLDGLHASERTLADFVMETKHNYL